MNKIMNGGWGVGVWEDRTWRRWHELEDCDCDWTHSTPAVGLTEKERRKERRNEKACRKVTQLCGAFPRCIGATCKTLAANGDLAPPYAAEEIGGNQKKTEEHAGGLIKPAPYNVSNIFSQASPFASLNLHILPGGRGSSSYLELL